MNRYTQGRYGRALEQFERAAHFAGNCSRHSLSPMQWHGIGTPVDRVQAYVRADLAAGTVSGRLLLVR